MPRKSTGAYLLDWQDIAKGVKIKAGWRCIRCNHPHDPPEYYTLTVHHLDLNKSNCAWWNIPALCQHCHLHTQNKVVVEQRWMFEHSEWFKPYIEGYYAHLSGQPEHRKYILEHLDELLALEKSWLI